MSFVFLMSKISLPSILLILLSCPKNSVNLVIRNSVKIQNVCSFSLKSRLNVVSEPYDFVM
jgi:hypothetical protein